PDHRFSRDVLENGFGSANVRAKLLRSLTRDELVAIAMAGDLVLFPSDLPDESWMSRRHLSQDEEGRPGVTGGQQREHPLRARRDAALETSNGTARAFLEDFGMEVLLDVHAEGIHDGRLRFHRGLQCDDFSLRSGNPPRSVAGVDHQRRQFDDLAVVELLM